MLKPTATGIEASQLTTEPTYPVLSERIPVAGACHQPERCLRARKRKNTPQPPHRHGSPAGQRHPYRLHARRLSNQTPVFLPLIEAFRMKGILVIAPIGNKGRKTPTPPAVTPMFRPWAQWISVYSIYEILPADRTVYSKTAAPYVAHQIFRGNIP